MQMLYEKSDLFLRVQRYAKIKSETRPASKMSFKLRHMHLIDTCTQKVTECGQCIRIPVT